MEVNEPAALGYNNGSVLIPRLKSYIMDKVEHEDNLATLEQIYAIFSQNGANTFED